MTKYFWPVFLKNYKSKFNMGQISRGKMGD